ncbi:hypothetical protein HDU90_002255 [Geranomyces variabilis]|nr:hypothetical protein HDU90_002255 [Geranomyces variabilis]
MRHCQIQDYPAAADDSGFLAFPPDYKKGGFHWRYRASGSNGTLRCSDYKDLLMDAWKPCTKMATDYITSHLPISQSTVNAGILLVAECSCPSLIELFREDIADIVSLCPAEPNFWIRGMDVSQAVRDTVIAACRNKDYKSVANAAPQFFIYTDFDANKDYTYTGGPGTGTSSTNSLPGLPGSSTSGARAYFAASVVSAATGAVLAWAASQF